MDKIIVYVVYSIDYSNGKQYIDAEFKTYNAAEYYVLNNDTRLDQRIIKVYKYDYRA